MKYLKKIIPFAVSIFFVILFCYAAISKVLDFENFQVQISLSPLLNGFSQFLPYTIIIVEVIIAVLLCYRQTRTIGLIGSFILMLFFTGYIAKLLSASKNLPCSCGGILEKMSWQQHLYFNIGCVILTIIALGLNLRYSRPAE
ncbi:MauE/DoxX family redox-associated membrane protein [uncultured Chryseobacterium sp.]|uniref:MauE/DoxX family redox-associated membrane protein n=1 Tax=uncultured Chryseobacterium sp. TaxID=259322 RepID=UPI0025F2D0B2|nr:MauE/DoxX family redox-associated membrane protein [uncultured Chryseobacterium sp.]